MVALSMIFSDPNPSLRSPYSSKANISQTVHATAGLWRRTGFSAIAEVSCVICSMLSPVTRS